MRRGRIEVATCQFGEEPDVARNVEHVRRLMGEAGASGADVAVFHEAALTGYAPGMGTGDWSYIDWDELRAEMQSIAALRRVRERFLSEARSECAR